MTSTGPVRRPSYGATSPVVGARGARTRQQIIDVALQLFAERGVHDTVVDDIAQSVGISRATLYQYFGSKEEIFRELLEASGSALLRVMRRLGRLGPTAEGYENLHWWLGEWTYVYEKYATVFIQWANVDTRDAPIRPMLGSWLETYTTRLSERLVEAGVEGVKPEDLAVALWSMISRFNYYRHTRATGLTDDAAVDNLAVVAQLILFPETPSAVLAEGAHSITPGRNRAQARIKFGATPGWKPRGGPHASLSDEAFATVRDILDAGARLFATSGYHDSNVSKIARQAGRSRGTFYKYFDGKQDVLLALARECAEEVRELGDRLGRVGPSDELRVWLADFLTLHHTHSGVFRVWLERLVDDPGVNETSAVAVGSAVAGITRLLSRVERAYPLDLGASALMVLGLLERLPTEAVGTRYERPVEGLLDTLASVMERGFLNPGT